MLLELQADLLAERGLRSLRPEPTTAQGERVAAPPQTQRLLMTSVVVVEAAWLGALAWGALRVFS
jgi:hypothetical protein